MNVDKNKALKASIKVRTLLLTETKTSVAEMIGITRPTLDARIALNNWRLAECKLIESL